MQTEANNYFHVLAHACIHVRGTMACIVIPPTALQMPIITQFDVCRNNARRRDSVTCGLGVQVKRSYEGKKKKGRGRKKVKKKLSQRVLTDRDFFDTIRVSWGSVLFLATRYPPRYPSPTNPRKDTCNGSLCLLMTRVPLKLWHLTPCAFERDSKGVMREMHDTEWVDSKHIGRNFSKQRNWKSAAHTQAKGTINLLFDGMMKSSAFISTKCHLSFCTNFPSSAAQSYQNLV